MFVLREKVAAATQANKHYTGKYQKCMAKGGKKEA